MCRSRHQSHSGSLQAVSRSLRTSSPASGNWCRTHGGMTELPPDTDSQARAYANSQPRWAAFAMTIRACSRQAAPARRERIDECASASDGLGEHLREEKKMSKPSPPSARSQPMPGGEQVRRGIPESPPLVGENLDGQPGVQLGVVDAPTPELAVLIVLDQVVVGVSGEGQGIEPKCIDRRHLQ